MTYDPVNSHAATHIEDTPQLKDLVTEAIKNMTLHEDKIVKDVDMGRVVGTCDVVKVHSTDEIVYGIRKNRDEEGHVPFTKSREGDPCSYISLQLTQQDDGSYVIDSAWIGKFKIDESGEVDDEPFPNSPNATVRSKDFWSKHAFVYGSQEIQTGTETDRCPW